MSIVLWTILIRNEIRLLDFENTRDHFDGEKYYYFLMMMQVYVSLINTYYLLIYQKKTFAQKFYTPIICLSLPI